MITTHGWVKFGLVLSLGLLAGLPLEAGSFARNEQSNSIVGGWTLDKNLSGPPPDSSQPREPVDGARAGRRGGGRGGGGFGGGGRGGFGGGGFGGRANAEETARVREAMRDVVNPPEHLVIVDAGSMIVLTGQDGRTLRLSPGGKGIKDENTGVERKTTWVGDKLVSEITGLGPTKITQTYSVDPEHRQLRIVAEFDGGGRGGQARTLTHVYNADTR